MIPKIIHLCWLSGDPYPPLIEKCIQSWKSILPDYEIMLWDTKRFDINSNEWVKQAFNAKKYAFAADYIRFFALYNHGGIYLDADVEIYKSFNDLLEREYILGEDCGGAVEAAVMGAPSGALWIKECLDSYNNRSFIKANGDFDMTPVTLLVNKVAKIHKMKLMPYTFLSPKDFSIGKIDFTADTYCVHHYDGKWLNDGNIQKLKRYFHVLIYYAIGRKAHNKLINFIRPLIRTLR